ncbi:MAG: nucleotidyltransferase domain-containing protein [Patescibacteria group bacterium]
MAENKRIIILFGSQVKGKTGKMSDFDIAVFAGHALSFEERGLIAEEFAEKFKVAEDKVDVVDLWTASPLLQQEVATHGKLLEGDEYAFLRFRVLAWKRYQDTAKFRRARERALAQKYGT